jgi:acyl carrier protein
MSTAQNPAARRNRLLASVRELVEEVSGADISDADPQTPWLELGLDSLSLTQLALQVQRTHAIKVSFRQVMEEFPSVEALVAMLDERLPPDPADEGAAPAAAAPASPAAGAPAAYAPPAFAMAPVVPGGAAGVDSPFLRQVIEQQLAVMQQDRKSVV